MAHIEEGQEIKKLRDEMEKKMRFLEGRISQIEDVLTALQERLRRM